jgi:hypothetical protein
MGRNVKRSGEREWFLFFSPKKWRERERERERERSK